MQCIRSCRSHKGRLPWLLSPVQAHKRRPGPFLFFSFLFRWCHPSVHAAALLCCWASVAWKENQVPQLRSNAGWQNREQARAERDNCFVSAQTLDLSCLMCVDPHVGGFFILYPLPFLPPPLPRPPLKADSVAWNGICLLLYDCTSTAEMPARLQAAARGGRDTPQPLSSLCPPSHRVLATGEKTSWVGGGGNKSCDTAARSDPTWRPAKVIRAAKSDSLACLAAAGVVMIYWSHCGKNSFITQRPAAIHNAEQSAAGDTVQRRRQGVSSPNIDGSTHWVGLKREKKMWVNRSQGLF